MRAEDFIVEEIIDLNESKGENGRYLYVKVKKRNWNTIDIVNIICDRLRIKRRSVGFAGIKDRNAVTTQYFSIYNLGINEIKKLRIKDVEFTPLFYGDKPIKLGDLKGNKFKINLGFKARRIDFIENYFGEQRFSRNNVEIAKCIFKKDFRKACLLINNKDVNEYLGLNRNDFIGALRRMDNVLLSLIISSYQSYLFNRYVYNYLKGFKDSFCYNGYMFVKRIKRNIDIPLLSFDNLKGYERYLKEDGLSEGDLIIRNIPNVIPLGGFRSLFVKVKDFKIKGDYAEFSLPKGSYGTVVIKKLESYLKD